MDAFAEAASRLPLWKHGRRPRLWYDREVRSLVIALHRTTIVDDARAAILSRVGPERTPSRSGLARFWKLLDGVRNGRGDDNDR